MLPAPKAPARGRGKGKAQKSVTLEASTFPGGGNYSAKEGPKGGTTAAPHAWSGGRGAETIYVSTASDGYTGGGGTREGGGGIEPYSLFARDPARASRGPNPRKYAVPLGGDGGNMWLPPAFRVGRGRQVRRLEWLLGGQGLDVPEGSLLVACGLHHKPGCREEGVTGRDPRWPAMAQLVSELTRMALWPAPWVRAELMKLLGRSPVPDERVFDVAKDWGTWEIIIRFLWVLVVMRRTLFSLWHI